MRINISKKLPGVADGPGLGATLQEPQLQALSCPWRVQMDIPQGAVSVQEDSSSHRVWLGESIGVLVCVSCASKPEPVLRISKYFNL